MSAPLTDAEIAAMKSTATDLLEAKPEQVLALIDALAAVTSERDALATERRPAPTDSLQFVEGFNAGFNRCKETFANVTARREALAAAEAKLKAVAALIELTTQRCNETVKAEGSESLLVHAIRSYRDEFAAILNGEPMPDRTAALRIARVVTQPSDEESAEVGEAFEFKWSAGWAAIIALAEKGETK